MPQSYTVTNTNNPYKKMIMYTLIVFFRDKVYLGNYWCV